MRLGKIFSVLKSCDPEASIQFDFCRLVPTKIDSYRGYYDQPAIGWKKCTLTEVKVKSVIAEIDEALSGKTYTGYKGGDYKYDENSTLYVDNVGDCSSTKIIGVKVLGYKVILITDLDE